MLLPTVRENFVYVSKPAPALPKQSMARKKRHANREAVYKNGLYLYSLKTEEADRRLSLNYLHRGTSGRLEEVALDAVPITSPATWDGFLGVGNALPFGKIQSRFQKPHKLHYEIPAMGDHRLRWLGRFMAMPNVEAAGA